MVSIAMGKREQNKEVTYLRDPTQARLIAFVRDHQTLKSKSRVLEVALEFYFAMADQYGLDDRWWPKVPDTGQALAADEQHRYQTRAAPESKSKGRR